jgi:hypothetical protein
VAISRLPRPRTFAASRGQPLPRPPTPRVGRRRGHLRSAACVHRRVPTPAAFPLSRPGPRTRGRAPATRHRREGRTRAPPRARRVDLQVPAHARARPWRERTPCVGAATEGERRRCGRRPARNAARASFSASCAAVKSSHDSCLAPRVQAQGTPRSQHVGSQPHRGEDRAVPPDVQSRDQSSSAPRRDDAHPPGLARPVRGGTNRHTRGRLRGAPRRRHRVVRARRQDRPSCARARGRAAGARRRSRWRPRPRPWGRRQGSRLWLCSLSPNRGVRTRHARPWSRSAIRRSRGIPAIGSGRGTCRSR